MNAPSGRKCQRRSVLRAAVSRVLAQFGAPIALLALTTTAAFGQATNPVAPHTSDLPRTDMQSGYHQAKGESTDYPGSDVHTAVEANARLAYSRATFHRMQDSLSSAIRQMQYNFDHSPELLEAKDIEQKAWEDYVAARTAALKSVKQDQQYQASIALKNNLSDKITEVHAELDHVKLKDPTVSSIFDETKSRKLVVLATVKLDYAQVATDMEIAALKADSNVADTRSKLMAAGKHVKELNQGFDHSMRTSAELSTIRSKIEDARIALITSEAFREGAVEAASQALDYAYYKNRYSGGGSYEYGYYQGYR